MVINSRILFGKRALGNALNKRSFFTIFLLGALAGLTALPVWGNPAAPTPCRGTDKACLFEELRQSADAISEDKWRDISYRELAKSLATDRRFDEAVSLVAKIKTPDTQALTIRGIGMAAASLPLTTEDYASLFASLAAAADTIAQPASKDIAYTYIAMSQSFARQDAAALATARAMTSPELRHKAFGEIAEVQAERKDAQAALATLKEIDSAAYRNKSTRTITLLLADRGMFDEAAQAAHAITNPTLKAEALQYILTRQQQAK